jgi:glycosyltransferase involved in cell wall biosynthesis
MSVDISLVIPVYNEHESLPPLHGKLLSVLESLSFEWQIIYVDDGSTDGSTEILKQLQADDARITVAIQRRNFGKSNALMTGFMLATGDRIITMDSDLQDDPDEIPRMLEKLDDGYDLVSGWKRNRKDPLSKRIPSKIANTITGYFTGLQLRDMNSGFKAYRSECAKSLTIYGDLHRYIPVIAHLDGYNVTDIPVTHHERRYGHSKYGVERLLRGGFDFLTILFLGRYGHRPLHFFGILGGILLSIGLIINLILAIEWFQGIRPIGDRPLLLLGILLVLVGLQFLTIGLIAELVVSLKQENENPLSSVRTIYRDEPETLPDESMT